MSFGFREPPDIRILGELGDKNAIDYGGGVVVEVTQPNGDKSIEAEYWDEQQEGMPFEVYRWTVEDNVMKDLTWADWDDVAVTTGQSIEDIRKASTDPNSVSRALLYQDAANHYGYGELDSDPLRLTRLELLERWGEHYGETPIDYIKNTLEEVVQEMADSSAAQTWSTPNDQLLDNLEDEGYDPDSVLIEAEFGDAVAQNGDLISHASGDMPGARKAIPEDLGLNDINKGGRIPSTEEEIDLQHAAKEIARRLKEDPTEVEKVLRDNEYGDQIYWGSSGDTTVWAKKKDIE